MVPVLISPVNSSTVSPDVTFKWKAVDTAVSYRIQVSVSPTFADYLVNTITSNTQYSFSGLTFGSTFYWKVQASPNGVNYGEWSTIWSFSVVVITGSSVEASSQGSGGRVIVGYKMKFYVKDEGQTFTELGLVDPSLLDDILVAEAKSYISHCSELSIPEVGDTKLINIGTSYETGLLDEPPLLSEVWMQLYISHKSELSVLVDTDSKLVSIGTDYTLEIVD